MIGRKHLLKTLACVDKKNLLPVPIKCTNVNPKDLFYSTSQNPKEKGPKVLDPNAYDSGYYKDASSILAERFKAKDPYYDPYNPYVWMHVLPRSWQPYLRVTRVDQMFGRMLITTPHLWGIAIAPPLGCGPDLINLSLFLMGSLYAHASTVGWDDIADVEVDRANERTLQRPLVAGITTRPKAMALVSLLGAGAFGILSMLSPMAITCGLIATPCALAYPFMKRFFQYPQVFLAFALNLGTCMGFAAVTNYIAWPVVIPLYIGGLTYTIAYDTIYAFQDIEADTKAGVYSTSQKFAKYARQINGALVGTTIFCHTLAGYIAGLHPIFLPIMGVGAAHLIYQAVKLDPKNKPLCDHLLNIAYRYGVYMVFAYIAGVYFAKKNKKKVEEELDAKKKAKKEEDLE